jgi:hypothetical protein
MAPLLKAGGRRGRAVKYVEEAVYLLVNAITRRSGFPQSSHCVTFRITGCPAGVAGAWTLACNGLARSGFR